eukprot:tig00000455_g1009.t1
MKLSMLFPSPYPSPFDHSPFSSPQLRAREEVQRKAAEEAQRKAAEEAQRKAAEEAQRKAAEDAVPRTEKRIVEWSVTDVCAWVREDVQLPEYVDAFKANGVDGKLLVELGEKELEQDLKVERNLHRKKFMREIDTLSGLPAGMGVRGLKGPRDCFISYSHSDTDIVHKIKSDLVRAGLSCWIDSQQLQSGHEWRNEIAEAITNAKVLVLALSQKAASSRYCQEEWNMANDGGKFFFPVFLEDPESMKIDPGDSMMIKRYQWCILKTRSGPQYEAELRKLIDGIKRRVEQELQEAKAKIPADPAPQNRVHVPKTSTTATAEKPASAVKAESGKPKAEATVMTSDKVALATADHDKRTDPDPDSNPKAHITLEELPPNDPLYIEYRQTAEGLVTGLRSASADLEKATHALGVVATTMRKWRSQTDKNFLRTLLQVGLLEALLPLMRDFEEAAELQMDACEVLADVAAIDGQSRKLLANADGLMAVVRVMRLHVAEPEVQESAVRALREFASADEMLIPIMESKAARECIGLMAQYPHNLRLQEHGANLLAQLCRKGELCSMLSELGAVAPLVRAIVTHTISTALDTSAASALLQLSGQDAFATSMINNGGVRALTDLVRRRTDQAEIVCHTVEALKNSCRNDDCRKTVYECDSTGAALAAVQAHSGDSKVAIIIATLALAAEVVKEESLTFTSCILREDRLRSILQEIPEVSELSNSSKIAAVLSLLGSRLCRASPDQATQSAVLRLGCLPALETARRLMNPESIDDMLCISVIGLLASREESVGYFEEVKISRQEALNAYKEINSKELQVNPTDSIMAALYCATAGQTIRLAPGRYCEAVLIDKDVHIVGSREAILEWDQGVTLHCKGPAAPSVRGITIRDSKHFSSDDPRTSPPAVLISGGSQAVIKDCDLSSTCCSGVSVTGEGTAPTLCENVVHDCGRMGIIFADRAKGQADSNDVHDNKRAGISINDGAEPVVKGNKIYNGKQVGILVSEKGRGTIEGNDVYSNAFVGIEIKAEAEPVVKGNKIHDGKSAGIFVTEKGRGTIEGNEVYGNSLSGIEINENADPVVRGNKIYEGKSAGIAVRDKGRGTIEGNDVYSNAFVGIEIKAEAEPVVKGNKIHDGKSAGIFVTEKGRGTIEGNEVYGNSLSGIEINENADPVVRGNKIYEGKSAGIAVRDKGRGTIEGNDVYGNENVGIQLHANAEPVVRKNKVHDGKSIGIHILMNGRGTIEDNEVYCNKGAGIEICAGGDPVVKNNRIRDQPFGIWVRKEGKGTYTGNTIKPTRED